MMKNRIKLIVILGVAIISLSGCAGWQRLKKSFSSSVNNGLERELVIVNQTGEKIYEDTGKFDIEVNDYRVKYWIDVNKVDRKIEYFFKVTDYGFLLSDLEKAC